MKTKTRQQVKYLLSKGSPLRKSKIEKLRKELHSGEVKIKG